MRVGMIAVVCALVIFVASFAGDLTSSSRLIDQIDHVSWTMTMSQFDSTMSGLSQFVMFDQSSRTNRYGDQHEAALYEILPGYFEDTLIGILFRFQPVDAGASPMKPTLKALDGALNRRCGKPIFKADAKAMNKHAGFPRELTHWNNGGNHWILSHYLSSQNVSELIILAMSPELYDWYAEEYEDTTEVAHVRELTLFEDAVSWFPSRTLLDQAGLTELGRALNPGRAIPPDTTAAPSPGEKIGSN